MSIDFLTDSIQFPVIFIRTYFGYFAIWISAGEDHIALKLRIFFELDNVYLSKLLL